MTVPFVVTVAETGDTTSGATLDEELLEEALLDEELLDEALLDEELLDEELLDEEPLDEELLDEALLDEEPLDEARGVTPSPPPPQPQLNSATETQAYNAASDLEPITPPRIDGQTSTLFVYRRLPARACLKNAPSLRRTICRNLPKSGERAENSGRAPQCPGAGLWKRGAIPDSEGPASAR